MPLKNYLVERNSAVRLFVCLLALSALGKTQTRLLPPNAPLAVDQGFCPNGVYHSTTWVAQKPAGIRTWGSHCANGDQTTGTAITAPFPAPAYLRIYLAGYPSSKGLSFAIENLSNGSKFPVKPIDEPRESWREYDFALPSAWRGKPLRLIADDHNTGPGGWLAFSEPLQGTATIPGLNEAAPLLLRTLSHFLLTMLPAFALCAIAVSKGVRDVVFAACILLAATGPAGYLCFWLWFIWPRLGHLFAFLLPLAALVCLIWILRKLDRAGRRVLKALLIPALLTGAAALLVLCTGFLYGGTQRPLTTPWTRFSHELPPDNWGPYRFAEAVRVGNVQKLVGGDWHSSDRPPLQAGIELSQLPYNPSPRDFGYTALGAILQSLWIFALWLLLEAFGINRRAASLALAVCLFSGFVFLNTFYVWPKLLAAAYMLGFLTIFLTNRFSAQVRKNLLVAITGGALLAFGMLAHGGAAFALIGFVLTIAVTKARRIPFRSLGIAFVTAFLMYLPWMLYQKLYDPPGDRLLKMHLAGIEGVDTRPFLQDFETAYGALSVRQILYNKEQNLVTDLDHFREYWSTALKLPQAAGWMRGLDFFLFVPNLGFLVVGPVALLIGLRKNLRSTEWRAACIMWLFIALTILAWCVLMFGPGSTVIHQGTYVTILLAYAGSILALWSVAPWLAWLVGSLQIALNVLLYFVWMRDPQPGQLPPEGVVRYGTLALLVAALISVVLLLSASSWRSASIAPPQR